MPPAFPVHGDVAAVAGPPISWPRAEVEQPSKASVARDEENKKWEFDKKLPHLVLHNNNNSLVNQYILNGFMIQFNL